MRKVKQRYSFGSADVEFCLSEEDRRNLQAIQERHPTWTVAMIFKRALGLYANNMEKLEPRPITENGPAAQAIEEFFGQ